MQQPFNQNNVTSILPEMNEYWPSLNGANSDFWSHEWSKREWQPCRLGSVDGFHVGEGGVLGDASKNGGVMFLASKSGFRRG